MKKTIPTSIFKYDDTKISIPKTSYYDIKASTNSAVSTEKIKIQMNTFGCNSIGLTTGVIEGKDYDKLSADCKNGKSGVSKNTIIDIIKDKNCTIKSDGNNLTTADIDTMIRNGVRSDQNIAVDQIKYLACQVANGTTRVYDSSKTKSDIPNMTVRSTFEMLPQYKLILIVAFFFAMYLFIYGLLSSFDVSINILNVIRSNSALSLSYWAGLLFGMSIPFVTLVLLFIYMSRKDNSENVSKKNITTNPDGVPVEKKPLPQMDYVLILLFMFVIYGLIAVLFIIPEGIVSNNILYSFFAYGIFILITVLLYIFYMSIPTFDGTSIARNITQFFVKEGSESVEFMKNNSLSNFRKAFFMMIGAIFVFGITFFIVANQPRYDSFLSNMYIGFLSAFAILLMPVVWLFNATFAINYFLFYPIVLIGIRFLRSISMSYLHYSYLDKDRSNLSDDFIEQLEHINDYSPSWNLIGIGPIKGILNLNGFDNEFSKTFIDSRNTQKNLAQDKYVFTGMFRTFMQNNNKNIIINIIIFILTVIFSGVFLGYALSKKT
jgi:hypothetical protein